MRFASRRSAETGSTESSLQGLTGGAIASMASNGELTAQVQSLASQMSSLQTANAALRAQAEGGLGAIPALVQAVNKFVERPEAPAHRSFVETKRIGKPSTFDGTE